MTLVQQTGPILHFPFSYVTASLCILVGLIIYASNRGIGHLKPIVRKSRWPTPAHCYKVSLTNSHSKCSSQQNQWLTGNFFWRTILVFFTCRREIWGLQNGDFCLMLYRTRFCLIRFLHSLHRTIVWAMAILTGFGLYVIEYICQCLHK